MLSNYKVKNKFSERTANSMIVIDSSNITKLLVGLVLAIGLAIYIASMGINMNDAGTSSLLDDVKIDEVKPVRGYSLVNHNNQKIHAAMFVGHWTFVFFGYTNCPDVCPATLAQLVRLNKMISQDPSTAGKFQTLFVSVDPDRDGVEHIKEFVKYFDPNFIGATGDTNNILAFEKQFGAFHVIGDKRQEDYDVGHTSSVFLVNPDGRYIAKFSPPMDINKVMKQLAMFVQDFSKS